MEAYSNYEELIEHTSRNVTSSPRPPHVSLQAVRYVCALLKMRWHQPCHFTANSKSNTRPSRKKKTRRHSMSEQRERHFSCEKARKLRRIHTLERRPTLAFSKRVIQFTQSRQVSTRSPKKMKIRKMKTIIYMIASNIFKIYGCEGSPHRSARKWPTILESKVRREHGDVDNKTTWVGRMSQNVSDHHVRRCLKKCGGYRNYLGFPAIPQKCSAKILAFN